MTGFGRSYISRDGRELFMELKSVNHRYLDISFRIPKALLFLEESLRESIRISGMKRGHLDVTVTYRSNRTNEKAISLDRDLVAQCARETMDVSSELLKESPSVFELIQLCEALTVTQVQEDVQEVIKLAEEAFQEALSFLQIMRRKEGSILDKDLSEHLKNTQAIAQRIAVLAPEVPQDYRKRLLRRLAEWEVEIVDPIRIAQEVSLMADRCAIDEELSRLQSHFHQLTACLHQDGEIGRRMDFLLQEMNREINTIGSKASHAEIAICVVDMKSLLEKLREQVQNVE